MRVHSGVWMLPFILAYCVKQIYSGFEFTNIKCTSNDKKFFEFEYCYIKAVNRSYKYMSLKALMHEKPYTDASANLQVLRRFKGYIPITMNVTFNVCKYMEKKNNQNPMVKFFDMVIKSYSNVYHKCPYDHDILVEKVPTQFVNSHFTDVIPLPRGDYAFYSTWFTSGIKRGTLWVYGTLS
ncbi:uncharacterized protein LOC117896020 [Drosophila subobscura]|uniref:uncharacterized protein LOC117896020 n=1 Tax=Drosophila subobscura TaxID=7241 RepID=UPI00155AA7C4|nr:uncharacterized protein LOC117896020 [Drosophila subobscura]